MPVNGMTYNSLIIDLQQYSEQTAVSNPSIADQIPQIITQAQISLANRLKIQGYRDVVVGSLTPGNRTLIKPTGWRNTITFVVRSNTINSTNFPIRTLLRSRSFELINQVYPDTTDQNIPKLYTDYDLNNFLLGPTPDIAYPFELTIYRLPDLLSPTIQTNYLTDFIPNALLFQCLLNLAPFLKDDTRIPTWEFLLNKELSGLNAEELAKIVDRTQTRTSQ
jgi:hypothetical protein